MSTASHNHPREFTIFDPETKIPIRGTRACEIFPNSATFYFFGRKVKQCDLDVLVEKALFFGVMNERLGFWEHQRDQATSF